MGSRRSDWKCILPGTRDLGNVKNRLFYKVSWCFGATFQIAFEKYTFSNPFWKVSGFVALIRVRYFSKPVWKVLKYFSNPLRKVSCVRIKDSYHGFVFRFVSRVRVWIRNMLRKVSYLGFVSWFVSGFVPGFVWKFVSGFVSRIRMKVRPRIRIWIRIQRINIHKFVFYLSHKQESNNNYSKLDKRGSVDGKQRKL